MADCDAARGPGGVLPKTAAVWRVSLVGVAVKYLIVGSVLAHAGHEAGHDGGGSILVPGSILLGSLILIGAGAYLDHTGNADGRLARLTVLLGIGGVLVGTLAAV